MKILFSLGESLYDCKLKITDSQGSRCYLIPAINDNTISGQCIAAEVYGTEFDLDVIPLTPDINSTLDELEENHWTDKFAKNATKALSALVEKMLLRVGCDYHINGLQDGDRVDITFQMYMFGTFDRFDLLELIPMAYSFFEVSNFNSRFAPVNSYETNRKDVLKAAKIFALTDVLGNSLLATFFTYPIQTCRVRHLSRNKKIFKVISKFHNMSEDERQKTLAKQEKFLDG